MEEEEVKLVFECICESYYKNVYLVFEVLKFVNFIIRYFKEGYSYSVMGLDTWGIISLLCGLALRGMFLYLIYTKIREPKRGRLE
ncbi:MAG: hypothetical protein HRT66_06320 [Flavobacteriaceae bacterium]|nr:hypothetical protein [Flavobacteriaceae bacterium]